MTQTSNALSSPTKSMVTRAANGNQGETVMVCETINHP